MGVFYKANEYAELNPNFVGCVERGLGIRDWLESQGHQYIVTDDKEGPDCGECVLEMTVALYIGLLCWNLWLWLISAISLFSMINNLVVA